MFKANLFKAKLVEKEVSISQLAIIIGRNEATVYRKMLGESDFTRNEMQLIKDSLHLTYEEMETIFFA